MKNKAIYTESQFFLNKWMRLLILSLTLFGLYQIYTHSYSLEKIVFPALGWIAVMAILMSMRLKITIDLDGIHLRFFPFIINGKTFLWKNIEEAYVRKYAAWEYGGWGYRYSGSGIAYTTVGFYGIQLKLKNGRKVLIGTHHAEELQNQLSNLKLYEQKEMV